MKVHIAYIEREDEEVDILGVFSDVEDAKAALHKQTGEKHTMIEWSTHQTGVMGKVFWAHPERPPTSAMYYVTIQTEDVPMAEVAGLEPVPNRCRDASPGTRLQAVVVGRDRQNRVMAMFTCVVCGQSFESPLRSGEIVIDGILMRQTAPDKVVN